MFLCNVTSAAMSRCLHACSLVERVMSSLWVLRPSSLQWAGPLLHLSTSASSDPSLVESAAHCVRHSVTQVHSHTLDPYFFIVALAALHLLMFHPLLTTTSRTPSLLPIHTCMCGLIFPPAIPCASSQSAAEKKLSLQTHGPFDGKPAHHGELFP